MNPSLTNTEVGTLADRTSANVIFKPLADLSVHPLAARMPMLAEDTPEMVALTASIETNGFLQPFIINERDQIMDGRHRRVGGKRAGVTAVPCIMRPDAEAASIIVESLVGRRHYTKGARAYLAAPLLVAAAEANKEARKNQLLAGANPRKPTQWAFGTSDDDFAAQLGFGVELARQAKDIHRKFATADERLTKWCEKFPDLVKQIGGPGKVSGYPAPEWAQPVPENLRERFEPQILSGEMGLGAVIQAIAGIESTKGQGKKTRGGESLFYEAMNTFQLRFDYYEGFDEEGKRTAVKTFADWLAARPLEFRQGVLTALTTSKP